LPSPYSFHPNAIGASSTSADARDRRRARRIVAPSSTLSTPPPADDDTHPDRGPVHVLAANRRACRFVTHTGSVDVVRASKRLSYVLRHRPDSVGLVLDDAGWAEVDALLAALGMPRDELERVVATNDKRRFAFDATGTRIRASQGHSVPVHLGYPPRRPPETLFHGTPERNVAAILAEGLRPGRRHAVHLSADAATARRVGERRGRAVVMRVDAGRLADGGAVLTRSENGVWLVDAVPPSCLSVLSG
jgi:putative RNA 2'-phosphotransferase